MYKNFNLTDEERKQIMEQHKAYGYKNIIQEQSTPSQSVKYDQQRHGKVLSQYGLTPTKTTTLSITNGKITGINNVNQNGKVVNVTWKNGKYTPITPQNSSDSSQSSAVSVSADGGGVSVMETEMAEGLWDRLFGSPSVTDAAKDAFKSQGHSHVAKDDSQELYVVFNGEKFYPSDIEYADHNDLGEIPRVENGKLIVANPMWRE